VLRLGRRAGVVVTGFVDDVREYLAAASVCVVPLRIARGIQNKILEAMAMARPVVATQQAFEGLDAKPGTDLLVADGEEAFAAAVIVLLSNDTLRAQIGRDARSRVEQSYSWATNLQTLDEIFPPAQSAMRRVS
jgi:glycosyltransferase involved in cell wall biosynthesis